MLSAVNKVTVIHNEYNVAVHSGGNALSNNNLCAAFGFFRKLCAKIGFRKKIQGRKAVIKNWIRKCNISQDLVTKYAPFFPDKALRNLIESGVIYYVA